MAAPWRSTVTIDGNQFDALSCQVTLNTTKDEVGMPEMGSLFTTIAVWADLHDGGNLPFATVSALFELANIVTKDKIVEMKIEFWRDDTHEDAICSFSFKGWISKFQASNPLPGQAAGNGQVGDVNHLLYMELEPALNEANYKEVQISN